MSGSFRQRWSRTGLGLDLGASPPRWVLLRSGFRPAVLAWGQDSLASLRQRLRGAPGSIAAAAPSHGVYFQPLELPFRDSRKLKAVLPFELEPRLPRPMDELKTDVLLTPGGGIGIALDERDFEPLREQLEAAGLPARVMEPDALSAARAWLLARPEPPPGRTVLVHVGHASLGLACFEDGRLTRLAAFPGGAQTGLGLLRLALRGQGAEGFGLVLCGDIAAPEASAMAAALGAETFEMLAPEGLTPEYCIAWAAAHRALNRAAPCSIGLLSSEPEAVPFWTPGRARLLGALGCLLLMLGALDLWSQISSREARLEALDGQIQRLFRSVDPAATRIVNAPAQLETKIQELERRAGLLPDPVRDATHPLVVLLAISEAIAESSTLELYSYNQAETSLRLEGEIEGLKALAEFQNRLHGLPFVQGVEVGPTRKAVSSDRIGFQLDVTLKEGA